DPVGSRRGARTRPRHGHSGPRVRRRPHPPVERSGKRWGTVDLAGVTTIDEINERIESVARTKDPDCWVTGHSLTFAPFTGTEIPASHVEAASGGGPGYWLSRDAHSMAATPQALEIAGIPGERD